MNLPTYSLSDTPPSTILNVCLAVNPYSLPESARPASNPSKGKERATIQNRRQSHHTDEDDWEDAEYRKTRVQRPPRPSPVATTSNPNQQLEVSTSTGWDEVFATANIEGWAIYGTHPLRIIHKHTIPNASLRIVLPLHRTNILFLVGGPPSPLYSPNKVIIYDSSISQPIASIEFSSPVLGLTGRRDKLVVVLLNRVVLLRLNTDSHSAVVEEEGEWATCDNSKGLVSLATDPGSTLLAFPGRQPGQVQVVQLPSFDPTQNPPPRPLPQERSRQAPYPSTSILLAHTTSLAALATTPNGHFIATASVTGTLIRVWDARTSKLLRELRRGTDGAAVWGLRFRPDGLAICASSDKGTIHLWHLLNNCHTPAAQKSKPDCERLSQAKKPQAALSLLKPYLPKYFHSAWSDAFFRLPAPAPVPNRNVFSSVADVPTIEDDVSLLSWIMVGPEKPQIVVVTRSGGWYRLGLETGGAEMECVEYRRFGDGDDGWSEDESEEGSGSCGR